MDYDSFCAICTVVCACTITICATIYRVIRKGNNFMTQAEKARAYDEAIKRAKEINSEQKAQPFDVMLKVFPELKEDSEDEKIRKALIEYFTISDNNSCYAVCGVDTKKILAWLEKQGEQKPYGQRAECLDCQFNYAGECKGSCATKRIEQKTAGWSEEDEKMLDDAYIMLDWYKGNNWWTAQHIKNWLKSIKQRIWWKPTKEQSEKEPIINVPSRNGMYICDKCSFPISQQDEYELVAKRIEQKPAWSEEDERKYEYIRGCIYHCCVPADAEYLCDWLETQLSK